MYRIIGIIDSHYIAQTHKRLKKVKIGMEKKKNINVEIKMGNLYFFAILRFLIFYLSLF